ncbi:MAG: GDYXXLXY domain-containing protein [Synergistaceae bacterium]|nr:GDYXXLXY domain-containing protein [Synergistaceae bacterium]
MRLFKSLALKYVAMAILPLGVLLWQPAVNFTVLALGERVLLQTRPLDPRDFLRGDYVTLHYDIADIPEDLLPKEAMLPNEDENAAVRSGWRRIEGTFYRDIYVTLKPDGEGIGSVSGVSLARPSGGLYLKGSLYWRWGSFNVDYGLGVYYVPEGTGRAIEIAVQTGDVLADVRIFKGRGVLKSLEVPESARQEDEDLM